MSRLDTLARRAASELQSEIDSMPVPPVDLRRIRKYQNRRTIRTSVLAVAAVVVVVGVPILLGSFGPEEPVTTPTTVPGPVTTIPDVETGGMLTVETSLGAWQWVRDDQPGLGLPDDPVWVELPEPPLPDIANVVWPRTDPDRWGNRWGPLGGFPVSSGDRALTVAAVVGEVDWSRFYTSDSEDGRVESRWLPLDGDCWQVEVCSPQTATLEIVGPRKNTSGESWDSPVVLETLVASIVPGAPDAVEFLDEGTGDLVVRLEATEDISAEQLMLAGAVLDRQGGMGSGGMYLNMLYVDGVGWVDHPWQGLDLVPGWSSPEAGGRDGGFWIVAIEEMFGPSATLHAWGSADGVDWQQIAVPYPLGDLFAHGFRRQPQLVSGDTVILSPGSAEEEVPAQPVVLRLVDGQFTEVDVDLSPLGLDAGAEISEFSAAPWGWVATTSDQPCRLWVSPDGTNWEEITTPDGADTGDTVNVQSYTFDEDGTGIAQAPGVPTPAESVTAEVTGSGCRLVDDGVYLEFEHQIDGIGALHEGENYPDFYFTSWSGRFVEQN